jgi:transcriptional antiterminator NusG
MQIDDIRTARIHRKQEAKSKKATMEMQFPKGDGILATDSMNPFAMFGGIVQEITKFGKGYSAYRTFRTHDAS